MRKRSLAVVPFPPAQSHQAQQLTASNFGTLPLFRLSLLGPPRIPSLCVCARHIFDGEMFVLANVGCRNVETVCALEGAMKGFVLGAKVF